MNAIARAVTLVAKLVLYGAALIGAAMSILVFGGVALRYVFLSPVSFTEEVVGLLFSAGVFLAIPFLFAMDRNIRVSLIADRLPGRWQDALNLVSNIGIVVFFLSVGYLSFDFAAFSFQINARTDIVQLPVGFWMALLPVSCFLTAFIVLLKMTFAPFGVQFGDESDRPSEEALG